MAFYPTFIASYMKETWLALDTQPGFSTLWGLPQNLHSATDPFLFTQNHSLRQGSRGETALNSGF